MSLRDMLFRADVDRSLADGAPDTRLASRRLERPNGVYNVHPAGFVIGVVGAIFALLFSLYAAQREATRQERQDSAPSPAATPHTSPPAAGEREIWIEVEP